MHAWALKTLYPSHKNTPFLQVGIYHGCKNKPRDDIRDTLYFKNENSKNNFRKVTTFTEFQLMSNDIFLDPLLTATHLFKTKITHKNDIRRLKILARIMKT